MRPLHSFRHDPLATGRNGSAVCPAGLCAGAGRSHGCRHSTLRELLAQAGFELIDEQRQQTAERIRTAIVQMVHHGQEDPAANLSANITRLTHCDYASASRVFSEVTGTTIERYYIHQRIERVKELLQYGQLTLSEIALQMHYSSTAYLSAQFKSITGLTPTQYKARQTQPRQPLDQL